MEQCIEQEGSRRYPPCIPKLWRTKATEKMWLASIASKMGSNWPVCHFLIQCCSTRAVCREEFYWKERERERVARTNITKVMQTCQPLAHFSICACHPCAGAMLIFSVFRHVRMTRTNREVYQVFRHVSHWHLQVLHTLSFMACLAKKQPQAAFRAEDRNVCVQSPYCSYIRTSYKLTPMPRLSFGIVGVLSADGLTSARENGDWIQFKSRCSILFPKGSVF